MAVSSGSRPEDKQKMRAICDAVPNIRYICLDVANGYAESFVDLVRSVREEFPKHTIFAGNVVSLERACKFWCLFGRLDKKIHKTNLKKFIMRWCDRKICRKTTK